MQDKWAHLGHKLGECFYCRSTSATYIHVPKNASSYIKACLVNTGDWFQSDQAITNDLYLIALRDPIERWISGMAQFIHANPDIKWTEDLIFNTVTFDDHTEEQVYFLQFLNLDKDLGKCTFFKVDETLSSKFTKWLTTVYPDVIAHETKMNVGSQDNIVQRLQAMIDNSPTNLLKLKEHFARDYKLIDSVEFYD